MSQSFEQALEVWAQETLNQHVIPWPTAVTWETVIRKLATLEEDLWGLRGKLVAAMDTVGIDMLEVDAYNLSRTSLYNTTRYVAKKLVAAGVPKNSLPAVVIMPALDSELQSSSALSGAFGALPYRDGMNVRYKEFAAGFGSGNLGWGQVALAYFGGAVLLMATGGLIAWVIFSETAPDGASAAVEATRAQVSVATEIRESQEAWDGLCREVMNQGGVCSDELGERPDMPVDELGDIGVAAPGESWLADLGLFSAGGLALAGLGLVGWIAYKVAKLRS